ncbi:hypothetical protein CLHUN_02010 [Ruminiclostridium hungatei]|uniref:Uncharacterized protein n=1 Tax=Ruminiclostridium hungatei TaxID=48256 RepID=A0A1V4SSF8_RUMHU|nr:hypothetical protein [Ruminiclostridium hungatei]OPX46385.1 hypothetical protein CLHUN_02010 [Ruminiclostridium hungatei]
MLTWKKNIFVNAIKARMSQEQRTAEEIIQDYAALIESEKMEILSAIG